MATMNVGERLATVRENLQAIELSELDYEQPGTWPKLVKQITLVLVFSAAIVLGYFLLIKGQIESLEAKQSQEETLKKDFEAKAFEAANIEALRAQMVEMNQMFDGLVSQLPSDTEVPGLLEDITSIGTQNGLEFNSIDLEPEEAKAFYIELPIEIVVTGTYHDLGAFVSGISGLPRIVTLHDFEVLPSDKVDGVLEMSILAKTYRYKEDDGE